MIFYPAIDLKEGEVVRLYRGDMNKSTVFSADPAARAKTFAADGCEWIHIVNLNKAVEGAAEDGGANEAAVAKIIEAVPGVKLQLGGGIRSLAEIAALLDNGISRVVLGTLAVEKPKVVAAACKLYPNQIAVAVDCLGGMVATRGWKQTSDLTAERLAARFAELGVAALIHTDIGRDGTLDGVGPAAARLAAQTELPLIVSGGVATIEDLADLKRQNIFNGVIVGRALYEGKFTAAEALAVLGG